MSQPVPVFYKPGPPPPALPLLVCQTSIPLASLPLPTVTVAIDLPTNKRNTSTRRAERAASRARSSSPYPIPPARTSSVAFAQPTSFNDGAESDTSDLTELSDESSRSSLEPPTASVVSTASAATSAIAKPNGEVGRINRGGYGFEEAMRGFGWQAKDIKALTSYVHELIDSNLDTTKSVTFQNERRRQVVRDLATAKFPQLEGYMGCWPVNDIMLVRLKTTSRAARVIRDKIEAANALEAARAGKAKEVKETKVASGSKNPV